MIPGIIFKYFVAFKYHLFIYVYCMYLILVNLGLRTNTYVKCYTNIDI